MKRILKVLFFLPLLVVFSVFSYAAEDTVIFNGTIPELIINTGMNKDVLDLSKYFSSNNTLTYKYKAGVDGLDEIIEIRSDGKVNIEASQSGSRSVIFIADDDVMVIQSNDVKIKISGEAIVEVSFSPNNDNIALEEGKSQTFAVSGNKSVEWHVDDAKINHTEKTYSFSGSVGMHSVKAVVDGTEKRWNVSVTATFSPPTPEQLSEPEQTGPVCGNNVREAGENCSSCLDDVKCSANTNCVNGVCVPVKQKGKLVLWLGLFSASVILIVMIVILLRKKGMGAGFFNRVLSLFRRNLAKKENGKSENIESEDVRDDKIDDVDLNPLVIYFKNNLPKYKKGDLVNQAMQQGWTEEQIANALSKIENSGDGNDKLGENKDAAGQEL